MARDLYSVLGVSRDADEDSIKKAFRKLAMKYHPDKSPGKANEQRFKEINQAHEVLSDKAKRALYDEFGEESLSQNFDAERARAYRRYANARAAGGGRGVPGNFDVQEIFGNAGGGAGPRAAGAATSSRTSPSTSSRRCGARRSSSSAKASPSR